MKRETSEQHNLSPANVTKLSPHAWEDSWGQTPIIHSSLVLMLKFNLEVKSESRDMGISVELQAFPL